MRKQLIGTICLGGLSLIGLGSGSRRFKLSEKIKKSKLV
jgi:hypothetical protein